MEAVRASGLEVWGVVLNDGVGMQEDQAREHNYLDLQRLLSDERVYRMSRLQSLSRDSLARAGEVLRKSGKTA